MSISSLSIKKSPSPSSPSLRKTSIQQRHCHNLLGSTVGMSICFDDPVSCIRASLLGQYPDGNEALFVAVPGPYCYQVPTIRANSLLCSLISSLHRYELRTDKKPKRRLVRGVRESLRHLLLGHIKLLILAIDVDPQTVDKSNGIRTLLREAHRLSVPVVFGMTRAELTSSLGRNAHIETSIVGVLNSDGAYQNYQELVALGLESTNKWIDLATSIALDDLASGESTILHTLSFYGHHRTLSNMIKMNSQAVRQSVNNINKYDGTTAVMMASRVGEWEAIKILVDVGADALLCDFSLQTALHYAALFGCLVSVQIIISSVSHPPSLLARKSASGFLPIHGAILSENPQVIKYLLDYYNDDLDMMGCFRVLLSTDQPSNAICSILLTLCKILKDDDLAELIAICAKIGSLDCLRTLLSWMRIRLKLPQNRLVAIIDKRITEESGTPAWLAALLGHVGIARELISHGADANFSVNLNGKVISIGSLLDKWKEAARAQN